MSPHSLKLVSRAVLVTYFGYFGAVDELVAEKKTEYTFILSIFEW